MTSYDQKILFTALAFIAVVMKDGENVAKGGEQKVKILAELLDDFCARNVPHPFSGLTSGLPSDSDAPDIDAMIEQHIKALRDKHETVLPPDLESLTKLYVRLQFRKIHRINAALFAMTDTAKMADYVLSQLDEEIEYLEGLS